MFVRLRRVVQAARAAALSVRAEALAADGKHAEALVALRALHDVTGASFPSLNSPIELNLLISQVAIGVADGPLAVDAALMAIEQLEGGRGGYQEADRRHLLAFARAIANYCLRWRDRDAAHEIPNPILDIPVETVSARLRHRFVVPPEGSYLDPLPPSIDQRLH